MREIESAVITTGKFKGIQKFTSKIPGKSLSYLYLPLSEHEKKHLGLGLEGVNLSIRVSFKGEK